MKQVLKFLVVFSAIGLFAAVSGNVRADTQITIAVPQNSDTVINTNAQFSGTAPANTIVTVTIIDTDTNRTSITHQPTGKVESSITSDDSGQWAYVPQGELVPGQFTVQASYNNKQNQSIKSSLVKFTVIDKDGNSGVPSSNLVWRIVTIGGGLAMIVIGAITVIRFQRKRQTGPMQGTSLSGVGKATSPLKDVVPSLFATTPEGKRFVAGEQEKIQVLDKEALKIEQDLSLVARELEETNSEVVQLRERLANEASQPAAKPKLPKKK